MNIKKILTILSLMGSLNALTAVQAAKPQESPIAIDTVMEDGSRYIVSKNYDLYTGWTTGAYFNLACALHPDGTKQYRLDVTFNEGRFTIEKPDKRLIFKMKKKKVVELFNDSLIGPSDYRSELTKDGTYYWITPSYPISEEQIQMMIENKVLKFRFEYDSGRFDREPEKNSLSLGLKQAYEAIRHALNPES